MIVAVTLPLELTLVRRTRSLWTTRPSEGHNVSPNVESSALTTSVAPKRDPRSVLLRLWDIERYYSIEVL